MDAVSYEGDAGAPYFEGSGTGLEDSPSVANRSISRCPDGADTNVNNLDFQPLSSSPGSTNSCPVFGECGDSATLIHDIQGNGLVSPLSGATNVVIEGVVVGDFQDGSIELGGFFIQEEDADADSNPLTSEGMFVFDGSLGVNVSVGDVVRVQGDVTEFFGLTQLDNVTDLAICSTGSTATAATVILPVGVLTDWENYEGMQVVFPQKLVVTDNFNLGRFGEVELSVAERLVQPTNVVSPGTAALTLQDLNDRSRIQIDDASNVQNPLPLPPYLGIDNTLRVDDSVSSLTGVLSFAFGAYEVHPTSTVNFTRNNARNTSPDPVGGTLKVASFNVLNYFTTLDNGGPICGPSGTLGCRGADNATEFIRQRNKIIDAIASIDADIVGLVEIENNPSTAIGDLVAGVNAVGGAGLYDFVNTGSIGTDAIKVGFIYKPAAVTPSGPFAVLDSSIDPSFNDTMNRPSLAQTFVQNSTGAKITIAVNHLKSKGSSCAAVGDPNLGDGQGNCNLTRTSATNALANWLATDPTGGETTQVLVLGDLNSYAKEDPVSALTGAGYTNLIESLIGAGAHSFVFAGQSGDLDHALASADLVGYVTGVTQWHINADEPRALDYNDFNQPGLYNADPFRSSDHDPIIVGLNLNVPPTVNATPLVQEVQYSDRIQTVTVTATDSAQDTLSASTAWNLDGGSFVSGLPADLAIDFDACVVASNTNTCTWMLSGIVNVAAGDYTIRVTVADDKGGSTEVDIVLNVIPEDASVEFDTDNPVSVRVAEPDGPSGLFTLTAFIKEAWPDHPVALAEPGDISLAIATMELVPVGRGPSAFPISCTSSVTGSGYDGVRTLACDFDNVPVNTYLLTVTVNNNGFYLGFSEDVVVVFDPSLGFTTGGLWFFWPGTSERTSVGYTMKYNRRGQQVQGNLLFIRRLADGSIYRVKSNSLSGLAIGAEDGADPYGWAAFGGKATYLEPGLAQPLGNYEFLTYVEDHGEPGTGVDRFWIEIRNRDGDVVTIMSMARDAVDNTVIIDGGNLVVPHSNQGAGRSQK